MNKLIGLLLLIAVISFGLNQLVVLPQPEPIVSVTYDSKGADVDYVAPLDTDYIILKAEGTLVLGSSTDNILFFETEADDIDFVWVSE